MKIVCDDRIPFIRGAFEPYADVLYLPGAETHPEHVADADAVITRTRTICNASLLAGSKVKVIATATIGFDHIDTKWCENNNIVWRNAPGCNSGSVAQYIASCLVVLVQKHALDISQTTLGVVGVGHVGTKVAAVGRALGMKVLLCDPPRQRAEGGRFLPLERLVAESDIITLHVPLQKEGPDATYHLFNESNIGQLEGKILINSSRGQVVDNAALKAALAKGALKGAILDVWENEPRIDLDLMRMLDVATPHIAGYSADGKANGTTASVHTVAEVLGLPLGDWAPDSVPEPEQALAFSIDARGLSLQEVLCRAILHTYDVRTDSAALLAEPSAFEALRGYYPVRREPLAFKVELLSSTPEQIAALQALGFETSAK